MSIVLNKDSTHLEDYIQIIDPPKFLHGRRILIEYTCTGNKLIGVEVNTRLDGAPSQKVFRKIWKCPSFGTQETVNNKVRKLKIRLPPNLAYNYNKFNKVVSLSSNTKLRGWVLDSDWWPSCHKDNNCYSRASVKVSYDATIPPPYSRPFRKVSENCRLWSWDVLTAMTSYNIPTCPVEEGRLMCIFYFDK